MAKSRLPPLAALEAFEAAARLGSFTRAAEQRHMTHSGISRHVQTLEHWCGRPLFERRGPRVALTDEGHALRQRLGDALQQLHEALHTPSQAPHAAPLHLHTLPSMAALWLLPRLAGFAKRHPEISLTIQAGYTPTSLPPRVPSLALRYGVFDRDGLQTDRLFDEHMLPVASPAWFKRHGRRPERWPATQMLRHDTTQWPHRLEPAGVRRAAPLDLPTPAGLQANDALLLLQAACHGLGVCWARAHMAAPYVAQGLLQALPAWAQRSERSYWLAYRAELAGHPSIRAFRAWALAEAARTAAADASTSAAASANNP